MSVWVRTRSKSPNWHNLRQLGLDRVSCGSARSGTVRLRFRARAGDKRSVLYVARGSVARGCKRP
eukprot:5661933-Prymnesium_polylepis.1